MFNHSTFPSNDYALWTGDWNLVLNPKLDTKNYKGKHNKNACARVIENITGNNLVDVWRAKYPHKREFSWHKVFRKINPQA